MKLNSIEMLPVAISVLRNVALSHRSGKATAESWAAVLFTGDKPRVLGGHQHMLFIG